MANKEQATAATSAKADSSAALRNDKQEEQVTAKAKTTARTDNGKSRLVGGWRAVGVFLGFAAGVEGSVVILVVLGWVRGFWGDERLFDSVLGGGFGVGLGVTDGECGLIFGDCLFAIVFDVVEAA